MLVRKQQQQIVVEVVGLTKMSVYTLIAMEISSDNLKCLKKLLKKFKMQASDLPNTCSPVTKKSTIRIDMKNGKQYEETKL